jgi:NTE family protein
MSEPTADVPKEKENQNKRPYVILALQGGGALGAFQVGAYQALQESHFEPDWVAGISIGAINASIIAGNEKPEERLEKLRKFWNVVAGDLDWWERIPNYWEKLTNLWKVSLSMAGGVSGFFRPNYIPGPLADPNSPEASSMYNTDNLRATLSDQHLVNLKFLNDSTAPGHVRLSLGATQVFGGKSIRFQNFDSPSPSPEYPDNPEDKRIVITVEHIMASGALAPWFPGIWIPPDKNSPERQLYWDGGITSNSSFNLIIEPLVVDQTIEAEKVVIFVIDLWGTYEREPTTFDEVCWRIKQTQYSSRIEQDIRYGRQFISNARMLDQDSARSLQRNPTLRTRRIDTVRVSYSSQPNEIPCGDALFSRTEIDRRIRDGYAAMRQMLEAKPWEIQIQQLSPEDQKYLNQANVAIHLF